MMSLHLSIQISVKRLKIASIPDTLPHFRKYLDEIDLRLMDVSWFVAYRSIVFGPLVLHGQLLVNDL
jgi:hypothetical protein